MEIRGLELADVTKFSYLKELVVPTVNGLTNGLPSGYRSAVDLLKVRPRK